MKSEKTKKLNKKNAKWWLRFCIIVFASIVAFYFLLTALNLIFSDKAIKNALSTENVINSENQLAAPERDVDGFYTFVCDRDFKVMQLTDLHICASLMSSNQDNKALNAVKAMISAEQPDLVIFTGDIAYPLPILTLTNNNRRQHQIFIEMMNRLGIYWTVVFGNHDDEAFSVLSRKKVSELYENSPHPEDGGKCLYDSAENVSGYGNNMIKIKNSKGETTQVLTMLDSHSYKVKLFLQLFSYENIKSNQIDWYISNIKRITKENQLLATKSETSASPVKSLAFWHIPIEEYQTAYDCYLANDKQLSGDKYQYHYGAMFESNKKISSSKHSDEVYERLYEFGSTQGIFCGHDHDNNYSITFDTNPFDGKDGIRLTFGYSVDYYAYPGISNRGYQRGSTVITVKPDGSFDCIGKNLYNDYGYEDSGLKKMTPKTSALKAIQI